MPVASSLRRARLAVVGLFFLTGLVFAVWVVNIPEIQQSTGISHAVLGGLLLLLGLGSVIGMQTTGPLIDRIGSKRTAVIGAVLLVVAVNLPGLAPNPWMLGGALFLLGLGNGVMDVAMNDQAVIVERAYGRPIMSSFHAFFSVGGAIGAIVVAGMQTVGLSVHWSLGLGAVVGTVLAVLCIPALLPHTPAAKDTAGPDAALDGAEAATPAAPERIGRKVAALAALAFLLMLAEGVANDWSALQAVERLDVPDSAASLAFGAFAIAMTVGRLVIDRIVQRFGPVIVVRYGSAAAALGLLIVVLSPSYPLTLAGWIVFGLGLSGVVPQLFTAAGNLSSRNQGLVISRVVGAGYVGLLAGPAVIGWVSHLTGLTGALVIPLVFCVAGVLLAGQVRVPRRSAAPVSEPVKG